jgi:methylmalonyl-CoA/ethylmalonyl-CoA epimerase
MIKQIHHINFIVRDLDSAIERYRALFGVPINAPETLPQRGVRLARFRLSEIWVILVQPTDPSSAPARYLEQHGEGFFLMSCQVDDVREAAQQASAQGFNVLDSEPRQGLDDWQVMDLDPDDLFGAAIQLVESNE